MRKKLGNLNFIVAVGLVLLAGRSLIGVSTDVATTVTNLLLFGWGIFCCVRADEKNNQWLNEVLGGKKNAVIQKEDKAYQGNKSNVAGGYVLSIWYRYGKVGPTFNYYSSLQYFRYASRLEKIIIKLTHPAFIAGSAATSFTPSSPMMISAQNNI